MDVVLSTLFLHHFSPGESARLLAEARRVAASAVVALDLTRHRLALAAISVVGPVAFRSRLSIADGKTSVRQAYTPDEIAAIAAARPAGRARDDGLALRLGARLEALLKDVCDVAVVGGSLAGSAAAGALARAGVRVVVLEKARFPRDKVCGCFLSDEAIPVLRRMGVEEELRMEDPATITRFALVERGGRMRGGGSPGARPLDLEEASRLARAAQGAERAGARMRFDATVLSLEGDLQEGFRIKGLDWELGARAVVGAWGRYSPLDGRLGRAFIRRKSPLFGFGKMLVGKSEHLANRAVLHFFEGGYVGLSRVEGGRVNLAALANSRVAQSAHHDFDSLLDRLSRESPALAADLEGLSPAAGPALVSEPVYLGRHGAVAGDVLCVGDAAGVIDPYTGTGMSLALLFGEAVAAPLAGFLARSLDADELRRAHLRRHREIAGRRFLLSRLFRPFFSGGVASRLVSPAAAPIARWAARATRA